MSEIHHLTGAYALDAVDDLERMRFEQHLDDCEDCRTEVSSLREAASLLSETTMTTPPPALRAAVLQGISTVRPLPPLTTRIPVVQRRWFPLLVAAALVAILGVGAAAWQPWGTDRSDLSAADQVLSAADAERVSVDLGEAGRATVVRSVSEDRAVIVTNDMAPAPEGSVFELWFQSPESEMVPAGVMPAAADQTVLLEGSAADALAVGITVEPEGGSTSPTSDPIALFPFDEST